MTDEKKVTTVFALERADTKLVQPGKYDHTPGKLITFEGGHFGPASPAATFELPWRQNARNVSCCPDGRYSIRRRVGRPRLRLADVPGRDGIEVHVANDATEIEGCIGVGMVASDTGVARSREAMQKLLEDFDRAAAIGEVWLWIYGHEDRRA